MRKLKGKQTTIRLDGYIVDAINGMPGDNDAEKLRQLIAYGIEYRDTLREVFKRSIHASSFSEDGVK